RLVTSCSWYAAGRVGCSWLFFFFSSRRRHTRSAVVEVANDGRPDFALNPFNGPWPTQAQLEARFCSTARTPTCVRRDTGQDFLRSEERRVGGEGKEIRSTQHQHK